MPLAEQELIARIARRIERSRGVARGIGDDCAVLDVPRGSQFLVTTDFSLEGVHFRRAWHPPESAGHRCLARGLSDIAAMGGDPIAAFVSLAMPAKTPQRWVDGFLDGLLALARKYKVTLAGGDVAAAPGTIAADIVVVGHVRRGKALLRSGANSGDAIYATGSLGAAAATVEALYARKKIKPESAPAHFFPEPRLAAGRRLVGLASSCIDLSDGLSVDLAHICDESGVGAVIYRSETPVAVGASLDHALHGGEDYELLFTAPPRRRVPARIAGVPVTRIGEIVPRRGVWISDDQGRLRTLKPLGFQHFR